MKRKLISLGAVAIGLALLFALASQSSVQYLNPFTSWTFGWMTNETAASARTYLGVGASSTNITDSNTNILVQGIVKVYSLIATNLTASRVLLSDASSGVTNSVAVSDTEVGYLDGVTSAIQTQLNAKVASTDGTATRLTLIDGLFQGANLLSTPDTTNFVINFNLDVYSFTTLDANCNFIYSTNAQTAMASTRIAVLFPNGANRNITWNSSWHTNTINAPHAVLTNGTIGIASITCIGPGPSVSETNVFYNWTVMK